MGLFSRKPKHPDLDPSNPVAKQIQEVEVPLKELIQQVSDTLEVVPADGNAYVFLGKPPKKFGVAMIEEGEVKSFVSLAKEKGLNQTQILKLNEKFRDAYEKNMDAERFQTNVAGKDIVVTSCQPLAQDVAQIVSSI